MQLSISLFEQNLFGVASKRELLVKVNWLVQQCCDYQKDYCRLSSIEKEPEVKSSYHANDCILHRTSASRTFWRGQRRFCQVFPDPDGCLTWTVVLQRLMKMPNRMSSLVVSRRSTSQRHVELPAVRRRSRCDEIWRHCEVVRIRRPRPSTVDGTLRSIFNQLSNLWDIACQLSKNRRVIRLTERSSNGNL